MLVTCTSVLPRAYRAAVGGELDLFRQDCKGHHIHGKIYGLGIDVVTNSTQTTPSHYRKSKITKLRQCARINGIVPTKIYVWRENAVSTQK